MVRSGLSGSLGRRWIKHCQVAGRSPAAAVDDGTEESEDRPTDRRPSLPPTAMRGFAVTSSKNILVITAVTSSNV